MHRSSITKTEMSWTTVEISDADIELPNDKLHFVFTTECLNVYPHSRPLSAAMHQRKSHRFLTHLETGREKEQ